MVENGTPEPENLDLIPTSVVKCRRGRLFKYWIIPGRSGHCGGSVKTDFFFTWLFSNNEIKKHDTCTFEQRHEKTGVLPMRKQRRRSASQFSNNEIKKHDTCTFEQRHEKTGVLPMRKQRRRSASQ